MKKIISVALSTILAVCSLMPFSAMANEQYTKMILNKPISVTEQYGENGVDGEKTFTFNVYEDDYYQFNLLNAYPEQSYIEIYDSEGDTVDGANNFENGEKNFSCVSYLEEGTYYINYGCFFKHSECSEWEYTALATEHEHFYDITNLDDCTLYECSLCGSEVWDENDYEFGIAQDLWSAKSNTFSDKKVSLTSVKSKGKKLTVKWKKISKASGYQVQYSTKSNFKNAKSVNTKDTSKVIKKTKSNKKYYVRVRAYRNVDGKKIYTSWSNVKK